jgi:hypothetical protein
MKRIYITSIGIIVGAIAGFAYYYFVGCASGQCLITSNPWISTGYGAMLGYFVSGLVVKK